MSEYLEPLERLLDISSRVVRGDPAAIGELDALIARSDIPPPVTDLAEQVNHLVVQKEVQEFRLERMIEDLLTAQAAVVQAKHDPLTGLPNRGLFHELLLHACIGAGQSGEMLALMFIDLDKFKQVNDTMGHDAGDELLVQVAQRLQTCIRDGDILARLGGDEFTVVLCHLADRQTGVMIAERIIAALNTAFPLSMGRADIGGSIGMSYFPGDADQAMSLLKNADVAMYRAKEAGRNTYRLYRREND